MATVGMNDRDFILAYQKLALAGKSQEEIATALGQKKNSMSVRVSNLRKAIATKYNREKADELLPRLRGGAGKKDIEALVTGVEALMGNLDSLDETPEVPEVPEAETPTVSTDGVEVSKDVEGNVTIKINNAPRSRSNKHSGLILPGVNA